MPDFEYRAKEGPERIIEGVIQAPTESVAVDRLHQMGYVPISVRAGKSHSGSAGRPFIPWASGTRRRRQVVFLSRYLASFLRSGIPLVRALGLLADQERDPRFRKVIEEMSALVKGGRTLSRSMEAHSKYFSSMYLSIIRAGEQNGTLEQALLEMAGYLGKEGELHSKIRQALAYPTLLMISGFATVYYILAFAVPKISAVFVQMGRELPLSTRIVVLAGDVMNRFWLAGLVFLLVFVLAAWQFLNRRIGQTFADQARLRIPFLGDLVFKAALSRFSRTLALSVANGLSFLEALRVSIPTLNNTVLSDAMTGCYHWVQKGDRFGRRLRQLQLIPPYVADLIMVGEESGKLDETLLEIAETYDRESQEKIQIFTSLLEPMIILGMGAVVGFIVIAMLLPVFEMNVAFV